MRSLNVRSGLLACLVVLAIGCVSRAQRTVVFHDGIAGHFMHEDTQFTQMVKTLTGGELAFTVQKQTESMTKVLGDVESGAKLIATLPFDHFFGSELASLGMPFGFTAPEHLAWMELGGGKEVLQRMMSEDYPDVLILPYLVTGAEVWFFKQELPSTAAELDRRAPTLRTNSPTISTLLKSVLPHATVQVTPSGPVPRDLLCTLDGLESGTPPMNHRDPSRIDNLIACGHVHMYLQTWHQPVIAWYLLIHKPWFESLSPAARAAITLAARDIGMVGYYDELARSGEAMQHFTARGGTIHAGMPADIVARMREAAPAAIGATAASDPRYAAMLESMRAFAKQNGLYLLFENVADDQRWSTFPGWESTYPWVER
jgi:TRAP-type mannitol/chloroaromatic compound transport system substrate-binding protein